MDGLEAAAHIRAQVNIPIIYLTGSSEAALDPAGVTIQKPVSDQTLHQTIQLALATVDPQAPGHPMPRGGCGGHHGLPLGAASGSVREVRASDP
jgi:DNA-binding response OmpR family regulator